MHNLMARCIEFDYHLKRWLYIDHAYGWYFLSGCLLVYVPFLILAIWASFRERKP